MLGMLLLTTAGCDEATGPEADRQEALLADSWEITLRFGEEKRVGQSVVQMMFGEVVADSRCPIDAVCVWMGDAAVELRIRAGMGPTQPLRLHTNMEPRSTVWNGLRVTLLEVQPAPRAAEPTRAEDYAVKVRVGPDGK